jgi:hypothetical protein
VFLLVYWNFCAGVAYYDTIFCYSYIQSFFVRWQMNLWLSFQIPIIILRHQILITPMQLRNMTSHVRWLFVYFNIFSILIFVKNAATI